MVATILPFGDLQLRDLPAFTLAALHPPVSPRELPPFVQREVTVATRPRHTGVDGQRVVAQGHAYSSKDSHGHVRD